MKNIFFYCIVLCSFFSFAPASYAIETIKIGVIGPLPEEMYQFGRPSHNAASIVVDAYNQNGGILGKNIEIITMDDECTGKIAINNANFLVEKKVVAIIGPNCAKSAMYTLGIYEKAKIISISPSIAASNLNTEVPLNYFFRIAPRDIDHATITLDYIKNQLKMKKIAFVHDGTKFASAYLTALTDLLKDDNSLVVVSTTQVDRYAKNLSSVIKELIGSKPDALIFGGYYEAGSVLIKEHIKQKASFDFFATNAINTHAIINDLKKFTQNFYVTNSGHSNTLPEYIAANNMHLLKYGSIPDLYFYSAYAATQVILEAIKNSKSTNTDIISKEILKNKVKTPIGFIGFNDKNEVTGVKLSIFKFSNGRLLNTNYKIQSE